MYLPSMENVTQSNVLEHMNIAMVRRSESRQRRTLLSLDAEATKVEFTASAWISLG